jgi:hypothetical protein
MSKMENVPRRAVSRDVDTSSSGILVWKSFAQIASSDSEFSLITFFGKAGPPRLHLVELHIASSPSLQYQLRLLRVVSTMTRQVHL